MVSNPCDFISDVLELAFQESKRRNEGETFSFLKLNEGETSDDCHVS